MNAQMETDVRITLTPSRDLSITLPWVQDLTCHLACVLVEIKGSVVELRVNDLTTQFCMS